jgi:DNA polymerase III sliding clamp (beta) subunit (PCNA family)
MRKVNRAELLEQLQTVAHGLASRDIIEQSSCFVFNDGEIMTYNDEVSCRLKTNLKLVGAVQSKSFMAILDKLEEEEIELVSNEGELMIIGARRQSGIRMEHEILLPVGNVDKPKAFKPLPEEFVDAVKLAQPIIAKSQTASNKFWSTCVHLHPKWIEACDNFRVLRYKLKTGVEGSTLVRGKAIDCITKLDVTEFCETENWIHFRNKRGLIVSCRRYIDKYPVDGINNLLKTKGSKLVLPKGLIEAAERADVFSSENADNNQVQIILKPSKLKIRGEGVSGWYEERKKLRYQGPALDFRISPSLLIELTRRHNECEIAEDRLKVDGGNWVYVTVLSKAGDQDNEQEEERNNDDEGNGDG